MRVVFRGTVHMDGCIFISEQEGEIEMIWQTRIGRRKVFLSWFKIRVESSKVVPETLRL